MRRIFTTEGLRIGDVLKCSKQLKSRDTGEEYWWTSFRVVIASPWNRLVFITLILKMNPDPDKDVREERIDDKFVAELLEPDEWPQGVVAMRTKHVMTGLIRLDT